MAKVNEDKMGKSIDKAIEHQNYITAMKGIACIAVALSHYIGIFKYAEMSFAETPIIDFISMIHADFLLNETFWLFGFLVISGYLVARYVPERIVDVVFKIIKRFLRLAIPIMFASLIIYFFYIIIGWKCGDTITYFKNAWYQNSFSQSDLSLLMVLYSPIDTLIDGTCSFNSPWWVLKPMFISSVIIYVWRYIRKKIKHEVLVFIFDCVVMLGSLQGGSGIIFICLVGAWISLYENNIIKMFQKSIWILNVFLVVIIGICMYTVYGGILLFALLLLAIPQSKFLNQLFQNRVFILLGDISFGVYSFHWPIYCSLGAVLMLKLWSGLGAKISVIIAIIVSMGMVIAVSYIFSLTCERWSSLFLKNIERYAKRINKED